MKKKDQGTAKPGMSAPSNQRGTTEFGSSASKGLFAVRAVKAFGEATRLAADKAFKAGESLPGRIKGARVKVSPDGKTVAVVEKHKR